jgi:hypothetical protein
MGHEANTPSIEDELCALYIQNLLNQHYPKFPYLMTQLINTSGRYFFTDDQLQYPKEDFYLCLKQNVFDFAIKAQLYDNSYAVLTKLPMDK